MALAQEERILRGLRGLSGGCWGTPQAVGALPEEEGCETFEHGDFLALQRCLVLAFRWEPGLWRPPGHRQTLCHGSLLLPFSHQGTRGNTGPLANLTGGRRHHMGTGSSGPPPPALTEPSEPYTHPVQDTAHPLGPPSAGSRPRVPPHPPTFTPPSTRPPLLPQPPGVSPRVCLALCPPQSTCCAEGAAGSLLLPPRQQSIFVHAPPAADTLLQPSAVLLGSSLHLPGAFPPLPRDVTSQGGFHGDVTRQHLPMKSPGGPPWGRGTCARSQPLLRRRDLRQTPCEGRFPRANSPGGFPACVQTKSCSSSAVTSSSSFVLFSKVEPLLASISALLCLTEPIFSLNVFWKLFLRLFLGLLPFVFTLNLACFMAASILLTWTRLWDLGRTPVCL